MIEKRKSRRIIDQGPFITYVEDRVILPNQKEAKRVFVLHPGAAAILALTPDHHIILTYQYRYPIQKVSCEIPAGKFNYPGEDPQACALRELEEETGYSTKDITLYQTMYPALGYSNEILYIFLAKDCFKVEHPLKADDDEFIEPVLVTKSEVKKMLQKQEILDSKTLIALQKYLWEESVYAE